MKSFIALISAMALVACDVRTELQVNADSTDTPIVELDGKPLVISEVCYDHVVYLVNDSGGMAPKIDSSRRVSGSPFLEC